MGVSGEYNKGFRTAFNGLVKVCNLRSDDVVRIRRIGYAEVEYAVMIVRQNRLDQLFPKRFSSVSKVQHKVFGKARNPGRC